MVNANYSSREANFQIFNHAIVDHSPLFEHDDDSYRLALKVIPLKEGESLNVETGALLACDNVTLKTARPEEGIWESVKRYFIGGKPFFVNCYTANQGGGWVGLEEEINGQVYGCRIPAGEMLTICSTAYLASTANVKLSTKYAGIKGCLSGLGIGLIHGELSESTLKEIEEEAKDLSPEEKRKLYETKVGRVYLNSRIGQVKIINIEAGKSVMIDASNVLAYTKGVESTIAKIGGLKTTFFSGERYMGNFSGQGKVFIRSGYNPNFQNDFVTTSIWLTDTLKSKIYMVAGASIAALAAWSWTSFQQAGNLSV